MLQSKDTECLNGYKKIIIRPIHNPAYNGFTSDLKT